MAVAVGIDVAKQTHWAEIKVAQNGKILVSVAVDNSPQAIAGLIDQIQAAQAEHGPAIVGIDLLGGIASLLEAMLLQGCSRPACPLSMCRGWQSTVPAVAPPAANTKATP